jgi:hypothetical protein
MSWITISPSSQSWIGVGPEVGNTKTPGPVTPLYMREADAVANFTTRPGN